jgi:hypothetical protein
MLQRCGVILDLAMAVSLWAETVEKNSAEFSFPTVTSVRESGNVPGAASLFSITTSSAGKRNLSFAWSVAGTAKKGTISLYTLSGLKIRTIPVSSATGAVSLDLPSKRIASGLYFATMSFGDFEKTINFIAIQ